MIIAIAWWPLPFTLTVPSTVVIPWGVPTLRRSIIIISAGKHKLVIAYLSYMSICQNTIYPSHSEILGWFLINIFVQQWAIFNSKILIRSVKGSRPYRPEGRFIWKTSFISVVKMVVLHWHTTKTLGYLSTYIVGVKLMTANLSSYKCFLHFTLTNGWHSQCQLHKLSYSDLTLINYSISWQNS